MRKSNLLLIKDILAVDLDEINLNDNNNFDEDDGDNIFHLRFLVCPSKFEKRKALTKNKWRINANSVAFQKMTEVLHVRRWEKKHTHTQLLLRNAFSVNQ